MASLLLPTRRKYQPNVSCSVNQNHPSAEGLMLAVPSPLLADAVSGSVFTLASSKSVSLSTEGLMCDTTSTTGFGSIPLDLSSSYRMSMSFFLYINSISSSDYVDLEFTSDGNTNAGFYFATNTSGGFTPTNVGKVTFGAYRTGSGKVAGAFVNTNPSYGLHHFVVTHDKNVASGSATQIYIDGQLAATTAITAGSPGQTTNSFAKSNLYVLARNNTQYGSPNLISNICVWNRILSDAEIRYIALNPWEIYVPFRRRIYFQDVAASVVTSEATGRATARGTSAATTTRTVALAGATSATGSDTATTTRTVALAGATSATGSDTATTTRTAALAGATSVRGATSATVVTAGVVTSEATGRVAARGESTATTTRAAAVASAVATLGACTASSIRTGLAAGRVAARGLVDAVAVLPGVTLASTAGHALARGSVTATQTRVAAADGRLAARGSATHSSIRSGMAEGRVLTRGSALSEIEEPSIDTVAKTSSKRIDNTIMRIGSGRIDRGSTRIG